MSKVPSGIPGFDDMVGGGIPAGSLILLAGNPGTGKTVFSARFLYSGESEYGEHGVYVSFAESREDFYRHMRSFGFDFISCVKEAEKEFYLRGKINRR